MTFSLQELLGRASTRPTSEPEWDAALAPAVPGPLLETWITAAIDDQLIAANTATLATSTDGGIPSARTVLVDDITHEGVWFATSEESPAGRDLQANPVAEIVLYFREHARQVRIRGSVSRGSDARSAAAFTRRGRRARAVTLAGTQSAPMPTDAAERIIAATSRLDRETEIVDPAWAAYVIRPESVEFWQSRHATGETRLRYRRAGSGWSREQLWP